MTRHAVDDSQRTAARVAEFAFLLAITIAIILRLNMRRSSPLPRTPRESPDCQPKIGLSLG
jgi:hypothetical protein